MGGMVKDSTTSDVLHQQNTRFGPGEPIQELAAVHKEFNMFGGQYSLKQAYRALHIVPADHKERRLWLRYQDSLVDYKSDIAGMNGHDRIVKAVKDNLESAKPLPVYWTTHKAEADDRVLVTQGTPIAHETQQYLVISYPTIPAEVAPKATLATERAKRATRTK